MHTQITNLHLRIAPNFRVDRSSSTMHDLAIMTGGREAAGHGMWLDQKTIQTGFEAIQAAGGQLRAAIKHPSLLDFINGKRDRVLDMPGYFSDIRVDGNKLVAGKFEFFETFKSRNPEAVATILEMAEKTPKLFGLSAEVGGRLVFVDAQGNEYKAKRNEEGEWIGAPDDVELSNNGLPTLRISHLGVAAFVDQPAANDGLFAKLSAMFGPKLDIEGLRPVVAAFSSWLDEQALHAGDQNALHTPALVKGNKPQSETPDMSLTTINSIKAEFGADKAKFSQAMTLLGEQPDITIEALKAKMVQADLAAAQAEVTRLAGELSTTQANLSAATKERDEWKQKFEAIKGSGAPAVVLGADTAGAGIENPWDPKTINYTKQAEISLSSPDLAAKLKAAVGAK